MSEGLDARPTYAIAGELQRTGDVVTGWCWSADRPSERLTIGLRIDGGPAAVVVAARLRLDLVRDGVCDGYHGFTIALPSPVLAFSVIEVFEWATGQVFGRLVSDGEMADLGIWSDRSAKLAKSIAALHARIPERVQPVPLRRVLREAGQSLRRSVRTGPALPTLPHVDLPSFSLVLHESGTAADFHATVIRLAPLLQHHRAEIVVISHDKIVDLDGLTRVKANNASEAMQAAAAVARGEWLVFLQAARTSPASVARLLRSEPVMALLGVTAMQAAKTAGVCWTLPDMSRNTTRTGLELLVSRSALNQAGGFDPSMDDGAGLHLVDLGLRLLQKGSALACWTDGDGGATLTPTRIPARARFAARWVTSGEHLV